MTAWPWYLLSLGAILIVLGYIGGMAAGGASSGLAINPRMSDEQIRQKLEAPAAPVWPGLLMFAGLICALVSVVWRLLLIIF